MPMKDWLHRLRPVQLYIVLVLSIIYFLVQLFLSHITHALTLLVDSYHMLCNIIALSGCILAIKHSKKPLSEWNKIDDSMQSSNEEFRFVEICAERHHYHHQHQDQQNLQQQQTNQTATTRSQRHHHEFKLKNTFGWTRIDILTMLIVCIFLASLSFSLLVEALQTLIHIDHQDTMHLPIPILILGGVGLILNGFCYLLIGGYTLHQGSFLQITSNGDVVLDTTGSDNTGLRADKRRLSKTKRINQQNQATLTEMQTNRKRQGFVEMLRDISSTIFVILCAIIVYYADNEQLTKYIDPIISIFSCIALLLLSYPYMKESCLILLQTIPASIDIEIFKQTLLTTFTDIVSVHDLHIWQLTASKYVSTVHIIFQNPLVYARIMDDVKNFFHEQGITNVTIQPEFKSTKLPILPPLTQEECLVQCTDATCAEKHCCRRTILVEVVTNKAYKHHHHHHKHQDILEDHQKIQQQVKSKHQGSFNRNFLNVTQNMAEKSKSTNNLSLSEGYSNDLTISKYTSEPQLTNIGKENKNTKHDNLQNTDDSDVKKEEN